MNASECIKCVASENRIEDLINPDTGLGFYSKKPIQELIFEEAGAKVMTIKAWQIQRSLAQNGPVEWLESTEDAFDYALGCLPPIAFSGSGFLVGEPYDHDSLTGAARFIAHVQSGKSFYKSSRPMSLAEFKETKQP